MDPIFIDIVNPKCSHKKRKKKKSKIFGKKNLNLWESNCWIFSKENIVARTLKNFKLLFFASETVPLSTERYRQVHPKSPNSKVKVFVLAGVLFRVKQASASQGPSQAWFERNYWNDDYYKGQIFLVVVCLSDPNSPPRSPRGSVPCLPSYTLSSPRSRGWPTEWA